MVFTASIHVLERLFMEQHFVTSSVECFFKHFHENHVVVNRLSSLQEQGAEFELIDGDFIVPGLDRNSQFQKFILNFLENILNIMGQFSVVMV